MHKNLISITVGTVFAGAAALSMAQESKPVGLSLRAGFLFPTDSSARDLGKTWFDLGADYTLKVLQNKASASKADTENSLNLSLDYYNKSSVSNVPVLLNFVSRGRDAYFLLGAGVGFNRLPNSTGGYSSQGRFAGDVGVGYDFQKGHTPLFAEARYFFNGKSELNGFAFFAGIRL